MHLVESSEIDLRGVDPGDLQLRKTLKDLVDKSRPNTVLRSSVTPGPDLPSQSNTRNDATSHAYGEVEIPQPLVVATKDRKSRVSDPNAPFTMEISQEVIDMVMKDNEAGEELLRFMMQGKNSCDG